MTTKRMGRKQKTTETAQHLKIVWPIVGVFCVALAAIFAYCAFLRFEWIFFPANSSIEMIRTHFWIVVMVTVFVMEVVMTLNCLIAGLSLILRKRVIDSIKYVSIAAMVIIIICDLIIPQFNMYEVRGCALTGTCESVASELTLLSLACIAIYTAGLFVAKAIAVQSRYRKGLEEPKKSTKTRRR